MVETPLSEAYDIVVVGAGPAGSSAARAAARKGVTVLLIDRRPRIGVPVQCAELVSPWVFRHACFSPDCIVQTTDTMVTHLLDHGFHDKTHEMKSPGYMLDRSLFDQELAFDAVSAGAKLSTGTKAISLSHDGLLVEQGAKKETLRPKVVVGADGVHSLIGRWAGLPPMKTMVALQYEVVNPEIRFQAEVFFHRDYEGGYAWFFPKGKRANIGLGITPSKTPHLPRLLDQFLDYLVEIKRLPGIEILRKTGGSIPSERPRQAVLGNLLLVGDAAGHAHPITGAGILNAVVGGEIAGRIAGEAVQKNDLKHLLNYENEWQDTFGKPLSYGAMKREFLEKNWNDPGMSFEDLIRKTWVGFKEYYEDQHQYSGRKP
jgi:digeranylgeranylglycerophospholipid reductase